MATTPTQVSQTQGGFAPEVAPYATTLLGQAQAFSNPNIDAPVYPGGMAGFNNASARYAQFDPLQKQSFEGAQQMQPAYQLQGATGLASLAGQSALGYNQYQPSNYQSQSITSPMGYGGYGGMQQPSAPGMPPSFQAPQNMLQQYMSPYVQNVIQMQQRDAQRQADIAGTNQQAAATKAGAFGGGRDAIMRAEAARNLALQKGDIETKGMQDAYTQALSQFNAEQQQRQSAAQLQEQSRQYGAGLGLQGLQTAMTGASTLGALGQNQFQQGMDINKLQNQYGGQQQQQMQNILGTQYQNWLDQQNQPYKQMGFMSDIIRGTPLSQLGSTVYSAAPSAVSQLAGLGATAYGASMKAGGGSIREQRYAKGGLVQDVAVKQKPAGLVELAIHKMA
jgi:hypothetical protein